MNEQPAIRLGFTRGVAPTKWATRWAKATPHRELELVPFEAAFGLPAGGEAADADMHIVRVAPGDAPEQWGDDGERTHHAMQLYEEAIGLVLPKDHELAEQSDITFDDLALVTLLDYPQHAPEWPDAEPWGDPSWMPKHLAAALTLVATGAGGVIAPIPLARHLSNKRDHAVLTISGGAPLPGTTIWATWRADRNSPDLQQLAGILRGRTANSSRGERQADGEVLKASQQVAKPRQPAKKKPALKPNSRGAQLAAAREKAERAKAAKRRAKKRR